MTGILLDSSGLGRAGKRAALLDLQAGRCALCGRPGCPVADHDHQTGLLRGLLCRSCNTREGRSQLRLAANADIAIYLARPPAAGQGWMWALPDWWSGADTAAVRAQNCTALDYVTALPELPERFSATAMAPTIAGLAAIKLPPLK